MSEEIIEDMLEEVRPRRSRAIHPEIAQRYKLVKS